MTKDNFNNIILFGGETKNENMPVGFYSSLAMLQLRGKPIIWWQLDNLKNQGLNDFIIVVAKNNLKLINYIKEILMLQFDIKLITVKSKKTILSSLKQGLLKANLNLPTRVILGDTLITKSINNEKNTIFTSKNITTSQNWCLVDVDKSRNIKYIYDKKVNLKIDNKEAIVGYYTFSDTKYLLNCCFYSRLNLKTEISDTLIKYKKKYRLKTRLIEDWYDLGHTSGLIKAKNILFNARNFNSITVNTNLGTLTKTSSKIKKLEDEFYWFQNLPEELQILTPRLISFEKNEKFAKLTQELYGYPSLQELYISGEVNLEDWSYILEKLFNIHKNFEKFKNQPNQNSFRWLYLDKTIERLELLKKQDIYWRQLLQNEKIQINGTEYKGINNLCQAIKDFAEQLSTNGVETVMHGDYCFSNILFDSSNYIFKLIDPRGRLNGEATIYGDARYDIAKLRHSVVGLYDFIVQGLFKLQETNNSFEYKILSPKDYSILENIFDKLCQINGYNVKEIRFIEGLLFLSMIPLHSDNIERQKIFYLKAVELLNNVLIKER